MAEPFRLAYVLKRYPRLSETFILNEMLELQRQGIDITIIAMKDPGEAIVHEHVQALKAPIYYFPPKARLASEKLGVRSPTSFAGTPACWALTPGRGDGPGTTIPRGSRQPCSRLPSEAWESITSMPILRPRQPRPLWY
jgi:hypothetical protein